MQIPGITPISPQTIQSVYSTGKAEETNPTAGGTFADALDALNQSQLESDQLVEKLAAGQDVDLHDVMISMEENDINFRVAIAIRDQLVDAYREVMRMNV
ncbi:MAG: flagellar hook-basal body complex protein FliE [Chloroflexi bacterium]|nr:flagellar hook-basal body complex protein FliE [Chloroflexota bacterium]